MTESDKKAVEEFRQRFICDCDGESHTVAHDMNQIEDFILKTRQEAREEVADVEVDRDELIKFHNQALQASRIEAKEEERTRIGEEVKKSWEWNMDREKVLSIINKHQ